MIMTAKKGSAKKTDPALTCVNCGRRSAYVTRRDEIFGRGKKAVIIEDLPVIICRNCGLTYLEPQVSRTIDEICAHPEQYTSPEYRPVAKIA